MQQKSLAVGASNSHGGGAFHNNEFPENQIKSNNAKAFFLCDQGHHTNDNSNENEDSAATTTMCKYCHTQVAEPSKFQPKSVYNNAMFCQDFAKHPQPYTFR